MNRKFNLAAAVFIVFFFSIILLVTSMLKLPLGSWYLEGDSNCYLVLNTDETFESTVYGNGTYTLQENEILLRGNTETTLAIIRKPLKLTLWDQQIQNYYYHDAAPFKK